MQVLAHLLEFFVYQKNPTLAGKISQQVHWTVQVKHCSYLNSFMHQQISYDPCNSVNILFI